MRGMPIAAVAAVSPAVAAMRVCDNNVKRRGL